MMRQHVVFAMLLGMTTALRLQLTPDEATQNVDLWDGLDQVMEIEESPAFAESNAKLPFYALMGPQDSGTNLMEQLVHRNFGMVSTQNTHGTFWKHSLAKSTQELYDFWPKHVPQQAMKDTVAIMMVRSPISQITSWKRKVYDMGSCVNRPYETFDQPCSPQIYVRQSGGEFDRSDPAREIKFDSTIDVVNAYYRQYLKLTEEQKFKKLLLVNYEAVVRDPEGTVQTLAKLLDMPVPKQIDVVSESAKGETHHGREEALTKLRTRSYEKLIESSTLKRLCKNKDYALWAKFTVAEWKDEKATDDTYNYDCG